MGRKSTRQREHRRERRKAVANPLRPGKQKMGTFYGHGAGIGSSTTVSQSLRKVTKQQRRKAKQRMFEMRMSMLRRKPLTESIGDMTDNILLALDLPE